MTKVFDEGEIEFDTIMSLCTVCNSHKQWTNLMGVKNFSADCIKVHNHEEGAILHFKDSVCVSRCSYNKCDFKFEIDIIL